MRICVLVSEQIDGRIVAMNILLITTLYPAYKNQSRMESSYAVHYFAKEWRKNHCVSVMRIFPVYPKLMFPFGKVRRSEQINTFPDYFEADGVSVKRIPIKKTPKIDYSLSAIKKAASAIINYFEKDYVPDLIICDMLNPSIYIAQIIKSLFGSKLVASLHFTDILYLKKEKNFTRFRTVEPYLDKIVFRSNSIEKIYWQVVGIQKDTNKYCTIPFGVDEDVIASREMLVQKIKNKSFEILTACSLIKLKNVDVLIKAFSSFCSNERYRLRIIGEGPEKENLIKLSESLGILDRVIFEGEKTREEVLRAMAKADVFALVSSPETFGLVYVEAMAQGCITIGSAGEGIDGVLVDNFNGFLCKPGVVDDLSNTLQKVFSLGDDRKLEIINNAKVTVERLTNESLADLFLDKVFSCY